MIRATSEIDDKAYENQANDEEDFRDGKHKLGLSEYAYGCKRID